MNKTSITLTIEQKNTIINQILIDQKIKSIIHPADSILVFTLASGFNLFISGHWSYIDNNIKINSTIANNESIKDNFIKIENLAENISKQNLIINNIYWENDNKITLFFNNKSKLNISMYAQKKENQFLSLSFSSESDDAHINIDYENKQWIQKIVFRKKTN